MSKNSLTVLGSSSGDPQADRVSSGYLLKVGRSLTLIDCGGGVTNSFLKRGFDPLDVDRVFISHSHPDHVCELPLFIQMIYLAGRSEPLSIYLPEEFVKPFEAYLPAVYVIREKLPFEIEFIGYSDGFEFNDEFSLRAIGNNHLRKYAGHVERLGLPNKMQSHSFKLRVGEKTVFYSGDLSGFDEIRAHIDDCDVVITELTHVDPEEFFEFAPSLNVGRFVVTHIAGNDEVVAINRRASEAGMDNLTTAIDGMEIGL